MQINIMTTARNDEEGQRLLELLGMPFAKERTLAMAKISMIVKAQPEPKYSGAQGEPLPASAAGRARSSGTSRCAASASGSWRSRASCRA